MKPSGTVVIKRAFDIAGALLLLTIAVPIIGLLAAAIFAQDGGSPFFLGKRVGRHGRVFRMIKLRTMQPHGMDTGIGDTPQDDPRVTSLGRVLRATKLDELPQLINVLIGQMSFVGPRPNSERKVALYSEAERMLVSVRPGVTDFASIVFSDLADLLASSPDIHLTYNLYVRPWKSRLGLHYVQVANLRLDIELIVLTALCVISRSLALRGVYSILMRTHAPIELALIGLRENPLQAAPPPGVLLGDWRDSVTYRDIGMPE